MIGPDDLIQEMLRAKNLVQEHPGIGRSVPIEMQIQGPGVCQQSVHQAQSAMEHVEIVRTIVPLILEPFGSFPAFWPAGIFPLASSDPIRLSG